MYEESLKVKFIPMKEMNGLNFAIKWFDIDTEIFLSELLLESIKLDKNIKLNFWTLVYKKGDKPILNIIEEIIEEMNKIQPGDTLEFSRGERIKTKHPNPKIVYNPLYTEFVPDNYN